MKKRKKERKKKRKTECNKMFPVAKKDQIHLLVNLISDQKYSSLQGKNDVIKKKIRIKRVFLL